MNFKTIIGNENTKQLRPQPNHRGFEGDKFIETEQSEPFL